MTFTSKYSQKELIARWDERLNPARYSGNDDVLDLIFYGQRKGNRIKLMRYSGISRIQFSAVFRGRIIETEQGSIIRGCFTKSISDYILTAIVLGAVFFIYNTVKQRDVSLSVINALLLFSLAAAFLLLYIWNGTKKSYIDILKDII